MKLNNLKFVAAQFPKIEHLFFDFDGVFTPNTVIINEDGQEAVPCSRFDGLGLAKLKSINFSIIML